MAATLTAAALAAVFAVVQYTNEINGRRHGLWYLPIFETVQHWSL